jgi:hypothetical protein
MRSDRRVGEVFTLPVLFGAGYEYYVLLEDANCLPNGDVELALERGPTDGLARY